MVLLCEFVCEGFFFFSLSLSVSFFFSFFGNRAPFTAFLDVLVDFLLIYLHVFSHNMMILFRAFIGPMWRPFLQTKPQGPAFDPRCGDGLFHSPLALKQSERR